MLEAAGYAVLEAPDADEAIALLEANPGVRLVVTDVHMPGTMDGLKLAHYIRDRWPPVRLVIVSGVPGSLHDAIPEGALFLSKPFEEDHFIRSIGQMVAP